MSITTIFYGRIVCAEGIDILRVLSQISYFMVHRYHCNSL